MLKLKLDRIRTTRGREQHMVGEALEQKGSKLVSIHNRSVRDTPVYSVRDSARSEVKMYGTGAGLEISRLHC